MIEGAERGFRTLAHCDHDLLVRRSGGIAGSEHAWHRCLAAHINFDLTARTERDRAFQPVRVRQQTDLNEYAFEFDAMRLTRGAVAEAEAIHLTAFAVHFGRLRGQ